jgi:hypothetical protein
MNNSKRMTHAKQKTKEKPVFFNNHDEMYRKLMEKYFNKIRDKHKITSDDLLGAAFI